MAAAAVAAGPTRLLEVCGQRLSRLLHDARHKRLAWLREAEEQGMRLLHSNFGAEPQLVPKTPSQRRRPRKRPSALLRDESREPTRRRLSRRRSSAKLASCKPASQRRRSRELLQDHGAPAAEVPDGVGAEIPALPQKTAPETEVLAAEPGDPDSPGAEPRTGAGGREREQSPQRRVGTSTPKAGGSGSPAADPGAPSPQGPGQGLFQDAAGKGAAVRAKARRSSARRRRSHRASLAGKYSLAGKRESVIRRSVGRAMARKAAARESSSASSRVSCQSNEEVFEDDVTGDVRPGLQQSPQSGKAPESSLAASQRMQAAGPAARHPAPPEQPAGSSQGSCGNATSEPQKENQEQAHSAKPQEKPLRIWTWSCKQAAGAVWDRQQPGARALSPLEEKHVDSANHAASPASKVVRPLKNFLQAVQRNQLLASPGAAGRGGVIRNLIKRNTPTRPDPKGDFVERERQRLESLRKKQEAEEQRKQKVEEEKRRRQAEMKQKREERLRKALQARERVEQMEEEKKKRMEQKLLQSDEKVRLPQVREEKLGEEKSKKKLSKKAEEAGAQKQKALRMDDDESEQQELLQRRREEEVKEKGKRVWELKNLVEQRQVEQAKERDHKPRGKEKAASPQLELGAFNGKKIKEEESPTELPQLLGLEKRGKAAEFPAPASNPWLKVVKEERSLQEPPEQAGEEKERKQPELKPAACSTWQSKAMKKSISTSCLGSPQDSRPPKVSENNYGMDLNSDDSTDDEDDPRKPVPSWADGSQLNQAILHQYYHPVNVDQLFGSIASPKLEDIFGKSKPRYFKRTSSAVWHSPPEAKPAYGTSCIFKN